MPQLPYFQAQLTQFPWGRLEHDGTFSRKFLQARFDVLDTDYRKAGFWAVPERATPHDKNDDPLYSGAAQLFTQSIDDPNLRGYTHGAMMLAEEWRRNGRRMLRGGSCMTKRSFHIYFLQPTFHPRPGQVRDWKSWYEWRGLSLKSPAAVLMDHVLTTYYLLTETLKVVDLQHSSNERQVIDVHYLGMETKLNYLPLFSELALLLPNTHINLTVFSPAMHSLLAYAEQCYPRPIAAREGPVWEYTAPRATGGGSITISL
ncbi:hypothetical protein C8F04DRAFT_882725, partial [Mycena alexandri]